LPRNDHLARTVDRNCGRPLIPSRCRVDFELGARRQTRVVVPLAIDTEGIPFILALTLPDDELVPCGIDRNCGSRLLAIVNRIDLKRGAMAVPLELNRWAKTPNPLPLASSSKLSQAAVNEPSACTAMAAGVLVKPSVSATTNWSPAAAVANSILGSRGSQKSSTLARLRASADLLRRR
jgi:hypothetical protein